jgi:hypothetical protein
MNNKLGKTEESKEIAKELNKTPTSTKQNAMYVLPLL